MLGSLLRAKLLRLDQEDHVLIVTMHHIISDGWSVGVFFHELNLLYEAYCNGKDPVLPDLPIQYSDFAIWQREWLQGPVVERQLNYWKRQLVETPPVLKIITDHPRPAAVQTFNGSTLSFELFKPLTKGLVSLCRKSGVTLFMTLMAAFNWLLYCYSGQDDILVGTPIAGRNRTEIENLIGFFVNTLVFRTALSETSTFRNLLERVREAALEAYSHQDIPFEKLVEELKPPRSLSHSPFFQVMFVLQNQPMSTWELSGLKLSRLEVNSGTAKFDLTLFVVRPKMD